MELFHVKGTIGRLRQTEGRACSNQMVGHVQSQSWVHATEENFVDPFFGFWDVLLDIALEPFVCFI